MAEPTNRTLADDAFPAADGVFDRIRREAGTAEDYEMFHACILARFADRVYAGEAVEPWILKFLADAFTKTLAGGLLEGEIQLPGNESRWYESPWSRVERRDLNIFCCVSNAVRVGTPVLVAIERAAEEFCVSFETARAGYYKFRAIVSKSERPESEHK